MKDQLRIAMLISGGGTTMEQILIACADGELKERVKPVLVIASKPSAGGIEKAHNQKMSEKDVLTLRPKDFPKPLDFGEAILQACKERGVDFIGQYGWLPKTPPNVVEVFLSMSVNQHPGPLRYKRLGFGGTGMFEQAVHAAVLWFARTVDRDFEFTEAIAQRVALKYDEGAVLCRQEVPIYPKDDVSDLQRRVLPIEHQVQIQTLSDVVSRTDKELELPDIVLPEEEAILNEAKRTATILFPQG